jgi:hypothetical protein
VISSLSQINKLIRRYIDICSIVSNKCGNSNFIWLYKNVWGICIRVTSIIINIFYNLVSNRKSIIKTIWISKNHPHTSKITRSSNIIKLIIFNFRLKHPNYRKVYSDFILRITLHYIILEYESIIEVVT